VKVSLPALEADIRPTVNVIDSETLQLVKRAIADDEVEVPAGRYVLSSTLPSGERALGVAEVAVGELEQVELTPETEAVAVEAVPEPAQAPQLETLGPAPKARSDAEVADASAAVGAAALEPFLLRYLGVSGDHIKPFEATTEVAGMAAGGTAVELIVRAPAFDGVIFIQLASAEEVPLNVALPANGMTGSHSCRLTVTTRPLAAVVSLPENPLIDAVARYMHGGELEQAANVGVEAEELLRLKRGDAFGAALGGYALLRLHQLPRLHDWPHNLAAMFPWLPDGPIIAGEAAALAGDYEVAVENLCEGARRGLPVFADGFSMLVSRLREYQSTTPPNVSDAMTADVEKHASRLVPLAPLIDFARISLAFHGQRLDDPLRSQEPIAAPATAEDWHRFTPETATVEP
jgi:hypothetical protein